MLSSQWVRIYLSVSLSLCVGVAKARDYLDTEITNFMKTMDVIPDILDEGPQDFLNITYHGNVQVDGGNELKPMQVRDEPAVTWPASADSYYTLLMVDPDMPNAIRPFQREFLHWMVLNIPSNLLSLGDVRVGYLGATPMNGSGSHRYVFLLYKQVEYTKFKFKKLAKHNIPGRLEFHTKQFAKKYNLRNPVAGNLFISSWSSDVPQLIKAIS
ncbi:hypothetical protein KR018_002201, partial [Drosophila ironensis]